MWYVEHWSLWLDVQILALTLWQLVRSEGINEHSQARVEELKGNGNGKG